MVTLLLKNGQVVRVTHAQARELVAAGAVNVAPVERAVSGGYEQR